jgi:hypothetical protein
LNGKQFVCVASVLLLAFSVIPAYANGDEDTVFPRSWDGKLKIFNRQGELTQVVFVRYSKSTGQAGGAQVVDIGDPDGDGARDGYALLGLRWNLEKYRKGVPYLINPSAATKYGLTQSSVVAEIRSALESWDAAVEVELYSDNPTVDVRARASLGRPDYKNVITWARISNKDVVAMASIWYDTNTKEILDADIVLNSYYMWGIDLDDEGTSYVLTNAFDIQNIVTHEAGHWSGLDDIYDSTYWAMTMYGYSAYGETIKISLEPGDVAGVRSVYC